MNINEMKELLLKASDAYYNSGKLLMSDEEYDKLHKEYNKLTGDTIIGAPVKVAHTVEVAHKYDDLAGTLAKTNNIGETNDDDDIAYWLKRLNLKEYNLIVTAKYDGNSVIEEFKDGKLVKALTRGEDGKGKDISAILNAIPKKRHFIPDEEMGVKSEVIMTYTDFDRFMKDTGKEYANPRSIVAGILNSDDGIKYAEYLTVVPLWLRGDNIKYRIEEVYKLIDVSNIFEEHCYILSGTFKEVIKDLKDLYNDYTILRTTNKLDFLIDGLVIEIKEDDIRNKLGYTNSKKDIPKFAKALKFPYMEKQSKVTNIEFWMSENGTGIVTPVCYFEPVEFIGATHQKQSLQNYKRFKELNLGIGSPILVQLRNDVLTYIEPIKTNKKIKPVEFIKNCPICNKELEIVVNDKGEQTFVRCINPECESIAKGTIVNWVNKLDIKGVGVSIIDQLYESKLISNIVDLYTLDQHINEIKKLLGDVMGIKVINLIKARSTIYDYELLGALNIEDVSKDTAKKIFKELNWETFMKLYNSKKLHETLINIEGIADKKSNNIIKIMDIYKDLLNDLLLYIEVISYKDTLKTSSKQYTFVITGKLSRKREDIKEELEKLGHKVVGSVTKNTDYLINNDTNSTTGKNKKAKELNIPIINEEELKKLL